MDERIAGKNGHGPDDDSVAGDDPRQEIPKDENETFAGRAEAYLVDAVESIPGGFALFDADDRLVLCNNRYRDVHPVVVELAVPGARFEDMARGYAKAGLLGGSDEDIEAIVEKRLSYHRNRPSSHEIQLTDGRWVEIRESKTHDGGTVLLWTNISNRKRAEILQAGRNKVLEHLATEGSLEDVLMLLVTTAEKINPDMLCSVLLLDDDGERLRHGAAPSLPDDYNRAVDGIGIGKKVGSCGAAAFLGETVIVEDIQTHPNWKEFKDVAGKAGLRACWSQPIVTAAGKVLGTFAMYYREPRKPTPPDLEIIEGAARLAGIAIEHKRMKETARQSEERLLGAIESLQDAFALYDSEDRLIAFNDPYRRIRLGADEIMARGGTFEDLLRENVMKGVIPEAVGREEAFLQERLEQHRNPPTPIVRQGLDDSWYLLDEVRTPEGGTALSFTDVSEIKRAEEALRDSEERFRDFSETASDWFWEMDENLRFSYFSDRFTEISGVAEKDLIGKTRQESKLDLEDEKVLGNIADLEAHRPFKNFEHNRALPNGDIVYMSTSGTPIFDKNGHFKGCRGTGTDITERKLAEAALKESEKRFREIAEAASDQFWEMDENLRYSYISDPLQTGSLREPEDIIGKTRWELAEGDPDIDGFWKRHRDDLLDHKPFRNFRYSQKDDHGNVLHLASSGSPIFDGDGVFKGYRGSVTDITGLVHAEEARRQALVSAEEANQAKSEFLATISHELRTPLNAILGFAEVLSHQYLGPLGQEKYIEYADDIHSSGEYLLELVNDILDISTIEAGKRSLNKEKISVDEIVAECAKAVAGHAKEKGVALSTQIPDGIPPLSADRRAIKQIVLNLLSNAIKFTSEGGDVTVTANSSKRKTTIKVADTGIGIPKDKIPTLKDPFEKGHHDPYTTQDGAGLGLAITNSLVVLHAGKLTIRSTLGKGTTVTVELPHVDK